jgi:hypothetical protein
MKVHILWHHYPDDADDENAKLLGVYSSRELAEQRIGKCASLPGFSSGEGAFSIDPCEVDKDEWTEGFFRVE